MSIEHKYVYNNELLTLDELHNKGILLTKIEPEKEVVYGKGEYEGITGTRYLGSNGDCIVVYETED